MVCAMQQNARQAPLIIIHKRLFILIRNVADVFLKTAFDVIRQMKHKRFGIAKHQPVLRVILPVPIHRNATAVALKINAWTGKHMTPKPVIVVLMTFVVIIIFP